MYIERNIDTKSCTIWIDREQRHDYRKNIDYQKAVADSKAAGYSVCVYIGGELPLLPVIDDMLAPNPITA